MLRRAIAAAVSLLLVGCTASQRDAAAPTVSPSSTTPTDPTDVSTSTTIATPPPSCPPVVDHPMSRRVDADSFTLLSFDGVSLRVNFFAASSQPAPTLLSSPGWASRGATLDLPSDRIAGELSIDALTADGYNVVTWDRRGAGDSGGLVAMGSLATEGHDVATIVDWIAAQPGVELDGPRDPRLGMFGGSYGGAIQLVAAAADCRIDAIVPNMVGPSWRTALAPADTAKVGWINLLYSSIDAARLEPEFVELTDRANHDGALPPALLDYLDARSATSVLDAVRAPTLLLQGTVDSLFTLRQSLAIHDALTANAVPTAVIWYCGGHGNCPVEVDDAWMQAATVAWFDRYVRDRSDAPAVPPWTVTDQTGRRWTSEHGLDRDEELVGTGSGMLALTNSSRSGPALPTDTTAAGMANVMRLIAPSVVASEHAVEVDVAVDADTLIVGAPKIRMSCRGTTSRGSPRGDSASAGSAPVRVFAQLVDPATGAVVGGQITPIAIELDGRRRTYDVELEAVVWHSVTPSVLRLQIVATAALFATPQLGGDLACDAIGVRLLTSDRFVAVA